MTEQDRLPSKRIISKKLIKRFCLLLLTVCISSFIVYFFKPSNKTIKVIPSKFTGQKNLGCATLLTTSIFPKQNFSNNIQREIVGEVTSNPSDIGIEITNETVRLLTSPSVGMGSIEPLILKILQDNNDAIVSLAYEEALLGNGITHSFTLNKTSGFAVWSKTNSVILSAEDGPYNVVSYLKCQ